MLTLNSDPPSTAAASARQTYGEFGKDARFAVDSDRAAVLLRNDVVADRQAEAGAFPGWFGRKERLEQLVADLAWNARPVIAHAYFHGLAEIAHCHGQGPPE